jgi:flagellar basal body-associated protein FliL
MMIGQLALAMAAVGLVGGLMAAQLAGSPRAAKAATNADHDHAKHGAANDAPPVDDKYVYVELDPVIVNLDEHRMLRYVRASVIIELDATNKKQLKTTQDLIERRKLVLKNRLTLFLAGRTPDEVRGDKALRHLERQIRDDFNQELWPDKKGLIHDVLFKEFAVQ